ncbi:minor capsid protein [Neobacillus vireti]|uniref:minor capsid protein n=1 Tax=Neobacillus vireti TaxID=220686 RepID=UPI002FFEAF6F
MRVQDLKEYVEVQVPYNKYVMNFFHQETPDNCCVVLLGSAGRTDRNVRVLQFQFLVRNSDPELTEQTAFDIFNHFNNKTDYEIASTKIVMSRGQQAVPIYTGTDESGRHIYSVNIEAIVDSG